MDAYVILAGGGVKGAALAGCLAAAEAQGIRFVGYGGTSAGSMVALLGAAGWTGEELETLLVKQLSFMDLLEDGGKRLLEFRGAFSKIAHAVGPNDLLWLRKAAAVPAGLSLHRRLWDDLGLYAGRRLREFLLGQIRVKLPALQAIAAPTFEEFATAGGRPIKVLATDLSEMRPARFPDDCGTYGPSLVAAVQASGAYPLVFKPIQMGGRRLTDGGLGSNLPAFMFEREQRDTRFPVLAFDLVSGGRTPCDPYHCGHLLKDLLEAALGVSDTLLHDMAAGVERFPIEVPPGIDAMRFDLTRDERAMLFDSGFKQATRLLAKWEPLIVSRAAGDKVQAQLQARYANPKVVTPILEAVRAETARDLGFADVRAHVMLPTNRSTRIVVYSSGMERDADADLELGLTAGCSGQAWTTRQPGIADMREARNEPGEWDLTEAEMARVPDDRTIMISVPIPADEKAAIIGTLSIDTSTLMDLDTVTDNQGLKPALQRLMIWSNVLASILGGSAGGQADGHA